MEQNKLSSRVLLSMWKRRSHKWRRLMMVKLTSR
jgi:hypothetical protein